MRGPNVDSIGSHTSILSSHPKHFYTCFDARPFGGMNVHAACSRCHFPLRAVRGIDENRLMFVVVLLFLGFVIPAFSAPPPHYYDSAQGKAGHDLFNALHSIISSHRVIPYSTSSFDTSDALRVLDADPANTNYVLEIYSRADSPLSAFGANTGWNREHQWCNSYGLDGVEPAYSDLFNLRASDENVNSDRANKYYDWSDSNDPSFSDPANAEAPLCTTDSDSWQPPESVRGDIARALFYMATCYTGDQPNEPHLQLTDNVSLITSANAYMGRLSTLLEWNTEDPPMTPSAFAMTASMPSTSTTEIPTWIIPSG